MEAEKKQSGTELGFQSLDVLIQRWKDGTFGEIIDDWKWIFTYSARYKKQILFYTILGLVNTCLTLVSSVASKYTIDIITSAQTDKLWVLVAITIGSALFSMTVGNVINRISMKMSIFINNDIHITALMMECPIHIRNKV